MYIRKVQMWRTKGYGIIAFVLFMMIISVSGVRKGGELDVRDNPSEADTRINVDTIPIVSKKVWGGKPGKPFTRHTPTQITVHHEGGRVLTLSDDATQRLRNLQSWCMGPDRNWSDIPYHLLIAPDGTVYEGRNPLVVGETNTDYDPTGHLLISFLGNYSEQKLDDRLLEVLVDLLYDSCVKYGISPTDISTHRDHSRQTTCPGEDIYSYFQSGYIVNKVANRIKSSD